jgi:transcriptional regulator with XRE-family HTH domain
VHHSVRCHLIVGKIVATPLGEKIKKLSMDALAANADMSKSYLWELENSDGINPTREIVARIAAELDTTPEFLFNDPQTDQPVDAFDKAFFRNYKSLKPETKQQLLEILKTLKKTQG